MTMPPQAVVPQPDELDLQFYQATVAAGALCIQRCSHCRNWTHPPRYYCPQCSSDAFAFETVSGDGFVYSYTVSHMSTETAWKGLVPYITVVAELTEGPRIVASGSSFTPQTIAIGRQVRIVTENKTPDFAFFSAVPAPGGTP